MCRGIIFKLYKKQTNFEDHEICQDLMILYVEAVVKIENILHYLSHTLLTIRSISEEESYT